MTLPKSNCPISPDFGDCQQPCEWYVPGCPEAPEGGCAVILILRELWTLRPAARARIRVARPGPGKRSGGPEQGPI